MKVEELIQKQKLAETRSSLPPLQRRVFKFFEENKGEVFTYHDADMLKKLSEEKASALGWAMWSLERKKLIQKIKIRRKTYFGLPEDIKKLEASIK